MQLGLSNITIVYKKLLAVNLRYSISWQVGRNNRNRSERKEVLRPIRWLPNKDYLGREIRAGRGWGGGETDDGGGGGDKR